MSPIIKRNFRLPDIYSCGLLLLWTCMVFSPACNTRVEGCLDIAAENFDLNADNACDDCCTYPDISISLSQKWHDLNFNTDSIYLDANNMPFRIRDIKYLLSSFSWIDADEVVYTIDSADIECGVQSVRYTPDIIQVDSRRFTYVLDTIRIYPSIRSLKLKVGWVTELECIDETGADIPAVLSDESPLWDTATDSRATIRVVLQGDLTMEMFDTVYIHTCQEIELAYADTFDLGMPKVLTLTVDYALWFSQFTVANINSVYNSILMGIPGSFSRTP